jgi:hypothetical protein
MCVYALDVYLLVIWFCEKIGRNEKCFTSSKIKPSDPNKDNSFDVHNDIFVQHNYILFLWGLVTNKTSDWQNRSELFVLCVYGGA